MIIELISIIVGIVVLCTCMGGGLDAHFFSYFLDIPTLVCILVFCIPILLRNGLGKDFGRAIKLTKKTYVCSRIVYSDEKQTGKGFEF